VAARIADGRGHPGARTCLADNRLPPMATE
jgi:hypothetical protein